MRVFANCLVILSGAVAALGFCDGNFAYADANFPSSPSSIGFIFSNGTYTKSQQL